MINGLRQVAQRAEDVDRAVAFYRDVLGLRLIARFGPLAFFDLDGTRLLLEPGAPRAMLYLHVDDIHAAHRSLSEQGVEFTHDPHVIFEDPDGHFGPPGQAEWMAFFLDSEGNTIALASRT